MRRFIIFLTLACFANAEWLGTHDIDDYVLVPADTHRFTSGALFTTADAQYRVYKAVNGVLNDTEVIAATNMTEDFDGITGIHGSGFQVSTANGFTAGETYLVVVTATVDSVAGGTTHTFKIRSTPLSTLSGTVDANLVSILGTAITETAGQIAAAFIKFFDIANPQNTINDVGDRY